MDEAPQPVRDRERRRRHLSIHQKLIGLIAVMISAIVGFLAVYFPRAQIVSLRDGLGRKASVYGSMLSRQVRSAVAFSDRATAREVLSSLEADDDVAAVSLFEVDGVELYAWGTPSPWIARAREGVIATREFATGQRIAVVTPVASLEGPVGTLVIELSTSRVEAGLRRVIATAVAAGLAALVFGIAAAWVIARSLARRLRAISHVARRVEAGDIDVDLVVDGSSDDIGVLAGAFNRMVDQLRREQQQLRATVEELTQAEDALALVNAELEARVSARTAELTAANQRLVVEMEERTRMELELRQAQKLESVGRLASGIAHEINTPVQYVSDSCHFLRDAIRDVGVVIEEYRRVTAELAEGRLAGPEALARVEAAEEDADLSYLLENMPTAVARSIDGLTRVAAIVRAMKEFAYPERKEKALADLNHAIETTLMVASNEYKYVADVKTELGALPPVVCHVGEFNQVVLNLIVNAAHAMQAGVDRTGERGTIEIRTWTDAGHAMISVRDTGTGISAEHLEKVFDPFFTTKEVGKGTGQGLAIARSVVVDKHQGKLTVESVVGRGTTFTIAMPIEAERAQPLPGAVAPWAVAGSAADPARDQPSGDQAG